MSRILKAALVLLCAGLCAAKPLTPQEALEVYLSRGGGQPDCAGQSFAVQIDAALPGLGKQGSMSGLKTISRTGRAVYAGLRFTGDSLVKTQVIARFLANDTQAPERSAGLGVNRENYVFSYEKTSDYNGFVAFVFGIKPKRKRAGLFKGELWLDAATAAPLRLWGDFVKSPSIFVRSFRFVQDFGSQGSCCQPLRLLVSVATRIAGNAEMAVWLRSAGGAEAAASSGGEW